MSLYAIFFVLGLVVGSFLNVVVLRLNTGRSIVRGRSQCFSCGKTLAWHELMPLVSFVAQYGRCRSCSARISWQYPAVELITGILFILVAWRFEYAYTGLLIVLPLALVSILVAITVYDLRHKIIPDALVYPFIVLTLIFHYAFFGGIHILSPDFLAGPALFGFFALLWLVSGGKWMGFGDAKLVLGLGWLLGAQASVSAMLLAFWSGAIVGLVLLYFKRQSLTMKSEIPFAPFLILGSLVALFFNLSFF
ncbi:MAG TPA: prepilin peptidase [Candidatus Paceibacterota bacterium]